MANVEANKPGTFCWIELATTDQNAAKQFYASIFGWAANDFPMGPTDFYTMFKLGEHDAGAACTLRPEQRAAGVPPHWMLYMAVESADASAQRAAEAGGQVLMQPIDVMNVGRMAIIRDPTGAIFCLWQPGQNTSVLTTAQHGAFCWADLNTHDSARARQFYGELFRWKFSEAPGSPVEYDRIQNGEQFIGGVFTLPESESAVPSHWVPYFLSSNCEATVAKTKELGGRVCKETMKIEGVGRIAILSDPQGAAFSIIQPVQMWP